MNPRDADVDRHRVHDLTRPLHTYVVPVPPKGLRETLCVAERALQRLEQERPGYNAGGTIDVHLRRIRHLLDECDRKRPTGPDGKHDGRHTDECGCADLRARGR